MTDLAFSALPPVRPSLLSFAYEASAFFRRSHGTSRSDLLAGLPMGDGHAVLVLPPALHGDRITAGTRKFLGQLNYDVYGWELGPNLGPSSRLTEGALKRLAELAARHGPVSIIGYSLGGLFARWLAHQAPESVRQIMTVCSPFREPLLSCSRALTPLCWRWSGRRERLLVAEMSLPVPVPGTYLFSRDDGIVSWSSCVEASARPSDNIEIRGPHVTITSNPMVTRILAQRLAMVHRPR